MKNEVAMLGAPKGKIAGVLSANDGWSMEVTMLDKKGRRAERRRQKGSELGEIFTPPPPSYKEPFGMFLMWKNV